MTNDGGNQNLQLMGDHVLKIRNSMHLILDALASESEQVNTRSVKTHLSEINTTLHSLKKLSQSYNGSNIRSPQSDQENYQVMKRAQDNRQWQAHIRQRALLADSYLTSVASTYPTSPALQSVAESPTEIQTTVSDAVKRNTKSRVLSLIGSSWHGKTETVHIQIANVCVARLMVSHTPFALQSLTMFSLNEERQPNSDSRFKIFQKVTECCHKALEHFEKYGEPQAIQFLIKWLESYKTLFTDKCDKCKHILSTSAERGGYIGCTVRTFKTMKPLHELCLGGGNNSSCE
eukprot:gb/GECH01011741.1/.p1 GENE.gb/GECH01011741.1/~~gb/GECH01011741.1/.p1  ORF type:complete len:290 (+),score=30.67 gb/GECH01011741.1/:1-870(+)